MQFQPSILVVDDDTELRRLICAYLAEHGHPTFPATDVIDMRRQIARNHPDLVVLDVMMPGEDGLSAARALVNENGLPVIMLSALGSDTDRIIGLEVGADDYLAKPCNPRELLARIRAVLRRRQAKSLDLQGSYAFAGWRLDPLRRELHAPDHEVISLSDGEFTLLLAFAESPQKILSRDQLLDRARGRASAGIYDRAIDSQLSRLRRKLATRDGGELIRTVRNRGYMLLPPVVRT